MTPFILFVKSPTMGTTAFLLEFGSAVATKEATAGLFSVALHGPHDVGGQQQVAYII